MKWILLLTLLFGCASAGAQVHPNANFDAYKSAHVQPLVPDEFEIYEPIVEKVKAMGFAIVGENDSPDVVVRCLYETSWDITTILSSLNVEFIEAKSRRTVARASYRNHSGGFYTAQGGVNAVFEKLTAALAAVKAKN